MRFINIHTPNRSPSRSLNEIFAETLQATSTGFFFRTLLAHGHTRPDPWVLAQHGLGLSQAFRPIIALNPFYLHPITAALKLLTLEQIYGRMPSLNLITGSFGEERKAIGDLARLEDRHNRLKEYLQVLDELLRQEGKIDFEGEYYRFQGFLGFEKNQKDGPRQPLELFVSGSSPRGLDLSGFAPWYVRNLRPEDALLDFNPSSGGKNGLALGICARPTRQEALSHLNTAYPANRQSEILFSLSLRNQDTPWNIFLREYLASGNSMDALDYNLGPLSRRQAFSPFLVGSYQEVSEQLLLLQTRGCRFILLEFPPGDLDHIAAVLKLSGMHP